MGERYTIKIQNATDKPWCFATYQQITGWTVVWQVLKLAPLIDDSHTPQKALTWALNYGICIDEFDTDHLQKFMVNKVLSAQLGRHYEAVSIDCIPSISQTFEILQNPHHIVFQNKTHNPVKTLNMWFLVDNSLIAVEQDVGGHLSVSYPASSMYYTLPATTI